ncbi:MAG: AGE family epimerase/isomerase [Bacteroidales bacterium]|nr:AGE family epimerase/isomerase [Bacteroidales bacterium]
MDLVRFREEIKGELEGDILPFWLALLDPEGGFYGEVTSDGTVLKDAPRGEILNARIIWTFAAAFGALGKQEYFSAALHARDWFVSYLIDKKNGGVFWSVAADGSPLDTKKQLYSQAFAIYAFSELFKVTSDSSDLEVAVNLFDIVESRFADHANGGYAEALSIDFSPLEDMSLSAHDINAGKTMNSHLHLLEAYANLYQVWPDPALKAALADLIHLMCERIMSPDGHLYLYFDSDWSVLPGAISYGHDIETSWLLLECAQALGDPSVVEFVKPFCAALGRAGNEGLLPDGSMAYELLPEDASGLSSGSSLDRSRQWWVQAETVVGNLWLWKYHSDPEALPKALNCWNWIKTHLISSSGEWYWGTLADGESPDLDYPKAGFWKCPYHNARMCLEALRII